MKKLSIILIAYLLCSALTSCNDNDESTGNDANTEKTSPDNRNDNNMTSGDRNNENNLQNNSTSGDTGADITPTDSVRKRHHN